MSLKRRKVEQGEMNYLISTSDLMAGLLFVFIIALAIQIISFNEEEERTVQAKEEARQAHSKAVKAERKAEDLQNRLAGNDVARRDLLHRMQSKLAKEGLYVKVDPSNGVLRLPEESITFDTGKATLEERYISRLQTLRTALSDELKCFHSKSAALTECEKINPYSHTLDAVFIEGHTDNQPFGGDTTGKRNRTLSTERANTVYTILLDDNSVLREFLNPNGQNLFSLSGYGAERPVPGHFHQKPTNDPVNRRIELRFLMSTPSLEFSNNG